MAEAKETAVEENEDAANVKEALEAIRKAHRELKSYICNMKYWFLQSQLDVLVANDIKRNYGYSGLVILKEEIQFMRGTFGSPAITEKEAEAKYGVEVLAEAAKEAEPIMKKIRDKFKELDVIREKLEEEAAQPEAITKKPRTELKEAEASCSKRPPKKQAEDIERKKMKL